MPNASTPGPHYLRAPSLLEAQTNFFLMPGSIETDAYVFVGAAFQNMVQIALLLCSLVAVPLLLIPIPVIEYLHNKHTSYGELAEQHEVPSFPCCTSVVFSILICAVVGFLVSWFDVSQAVIQVGCGCSIAKFLH